MRTSVSLLRCRCYERSEPTTYPGLIQLILSTKHRAQTFLFNRDDDSVQVNNGERQENNGHDLVQHSSLSKICDG